MKMTDEASRVTVAVENVSGLSAVPEESMFRQWVSAAASALDTHIGVAIRVVDEGEIADLNRRYRGADKATNVLSFPFEKMPGIEENHDGDVAICAAVVEREAREQGKASLAHWAHMTIHGVLHLLGFDHEQDDEAETMEDHERRILASLGFNDPYLETNGK